MGCIQSRPRGVKENRDDEKTEAVPSDTKADVAGSSEVKSEAVERGSFLWDDGVVHHPLGAGSYYFEDRKAFFEAAVLAPLGLLDSQSTPPDSLKSPDVKESPDVREIPHKVIVHVGVQPNNSPHIGTIVTLATAGILAKSVGAYPGTVPLDVVLSLDFVDTAPDDAQTETDQHNVKYQRSHRRTGSMDSFLGDYDEVIHQVRERIGFGEHQIRMTRQIDLLSDPNAGKVLDTVVRLRDPNRLWRNLSPRHGGESLSLRAACPAPGCGRADKHGIHNEYLAPSTAGQLHSISFQCIEHGRHVLDLNKPDDVRKLEMSTPLRNVVRTYIQGLDPEARHLRVTGSDYAGTYQERTLFASLPILSFSGVINPIAFPPVIVYTPLIVDWAGSKISKSLYLRQNAYRYLEDQGADELLSFDKLKKKTGGSLDFVFEEVEQWMEQPKKLFRPYSYLHFLRLAKGEGPAREKQGQEEKTLNQCMERRRSGVEEA